MTTHIDNIITSCARVLYLLHTLCSHGMPPPALHAVFQSAALAKVTYASPAWWGFTNAADTAEQLGMITAYTLHLLSPHSGIKPILCLIT